MAASYEHDLLLTIRLLHLKAALPALDDLSGGLARTLICKIENHFAGVERIERPPDAVVQKALDEIA